MMDCFIWGGFQIDAGFSGTRFPHCFGIGVAWTWMSHRLTPTWKPRRSPAWMLTELLLHSAAFTSSDTGLVSIIAKYFLLAEVLSLSLSLSPWLIYAHCSLKEAFSEALWSNKTINPRPNEPSNILALHPNEPKDLNVLLTTCFKTYLKHNPDFYQQMRFNTLTFWSRAFEHPRS